jgi:hypothetical protein
MRYEKAGSVGARPAPDDNAGGEQRVNSDLCEACFEDKGGFPP